MKNILIIGILVIVASAIATEAELNAQDNASNTTLIDAARNGDTKTVRALIAAGAEVNAQDDDDNTALILAANNGYTEIVEMLTAAGAR